MCLTLKAENVSHIATDDLSRPLDTSETLSGVVIIKPVGEGAGWPFLKTKNEEYKLEIKKGSPLKDQLLKLKAGDGYLIQKENYPGAPQSVLVTKMTKLFEDGIKTTKSGKVFIRDMSNKALDPAWRDERGVIWGSPVLTAKSGPANLIPLKTPLDIVRKTAPNYPKKVISRIW